MMRVTRSPICRATRARSYAPSRRSLPTCNRQSQAAPALSTISTTIGRNPCDHQGRRLCLGVASMPSVEVGRSLLKGLILPSDGPRICPDRAFALVVAQPLHLRSVSTHGTCELAGAERHRAGAALSGGVGDRAG